MAVAILECYDPVETNNLQDLDFSKNSKGWMKFRDAVEGCERSLLRFYSKHVPCSCLDERYKALKSQPKTGICVHCEQRKERSSLMVCTGCERHQYCSRECHVAAWPGHKKSGAGELPTADTKTLCKL